MTNAQYHSPLDARPIEKWTTPLMGAFRHVLRLQGVSRFERAVLGFYKILSVLGCVSGLQKPKMPINDREHGESAEFRPLQSIKKADAIQNGKIAVVVPSFAKTSIDSQQLAAALEPLLHQSRVPDILICVDDCGPIPSTLPLNFRANLPEAELIRLDRNQGPAAARNVGMARASQLGATIVCFMDVDCLPEPGWVEAMEAAQKRSPGIVSGCTVSNDPDSAIGRFHDVFGTLNGRMFTDGSLLYACSCNLSVNLAAAPLRFDESFRAAAFEDVDFTYRARQQGVSLTYCKDALVRHHFDPSLLSFLKQFHRYAKAEHILTSKHTKYLAELWTTTNISPRHDINPLFCAREGRAFIPKEARKGRIVNPREGKGLIPREGRGFIPNLPYALG